MKFGYPRKILRDILKEHCEKTSTKFTIEGFRKDIWDRALSRIKGFTGQLVKGMFLAHFGYCLRCIQIIMYNIMFIQQIMLILMLLSHFGDFDCDSTATYAFFGFFESSRSLNALSAQFLRSCSESQRIRSGVANEQKFFNLFKKFLVCSAVSVESLCRIQLKVQNVRSKNVVTILS